MDRLQLGRGPFYQSKRLDLYRETAQKLLASPPTAASAKKKWSSAALRLSPGSPMYDRRCRRIEPGVAASRSRGRSRRRALCHSGGGETSFDDAVFGKVEFANAEIEDFVLLRSDGIPTYHLSVVADDIDMRLTHIIRGADHISNTPKQVLQYRALGAAMPVFAHVPLILGPDKTRLSKRHGATSVIAYKEMGIVPEAFRNFLALLGWTPGAAGKDSDGKDRELFGSDELVRLFSLDGISKSNAVFDNDKLAWFNTEYIRAYDGAKLLPLIEEEWEKAGLAPIGLKRTPCDHRLG